MPVNGMTHTGAQASADLVIRHVGSDIGLVEPDEAPLVTLHSRVPDGPRTPNTKFEFKEDDFLVRYVTTTAAIINAGVTAIPLVDSTPVVVGDMLVCPAAANSSNQPERMRITAIDRGTHTLTVTRATGGVGAMNIPASTPLRVIGPAYGEGSVIPQSKRTTPSNLFNYTQIFKKSADWTRTAQQIQLYGLPSGQVPYDHKKLMVELKRDLNASLMFGVPSENLTGSEDGLPLRTTGGLMSRITTNVLDMGGAVTYNAFMAASNTIFRHGSSTKILLCPGILYEGFHAWAHKKVLNPRVESVVGVRVTRIETPYGTFLCVLDRTLENVSGVGFGNMAFAVDLPHIKRRVLGGNGADSDIKIYRDAIQDGRDRQVDYIMGELGWEIKQERYHARMYNITSVTDLT